jgi:hypothetical protein
MKIWYLSTGSYSDYSVGPYFSTKMEAKKAKDYLNDRKQPYRDEYSGPYEANLIDIFDPKEYFKTDFEYTEITIYDDRVGQTPYAPEWIERDYGKETVRYEEPTYEGDDGYSVLVKDAWKYTNDQLKKIYHDKVAEFKYKQLEEGK